MAARMIRKGLADGIKRNGGLFILGHVSHYKDFGFYSEYIGTHFRVSSRA